MRAGDPDRLAQLGGALVDGAGHGQRVAERGAGVALERRHPPRRPRASRARCGSPRGSGRRACGSGQAGEQRRAALRVAARLDQLERPLERGDPVPRPVEVALRARDRLEDRGGPPRVRLRPERGEGVLEQREPASRVAERARGVAARVSRRRGRRRPAPRAPAPGPTAGSRGRAAPPPPRGRTRARRRRGPHRGGQRRRPVARGAEVMGDRRRGLRVGAGFEPLLERPREREVQRRPLAREQVVLDDLAQERVAEPVDAVVVDDQRCARRRPPAARHEARAPRARSSPRAARGRAARRRPRARSSSRAGSDSRSTRSISASRSVSGAAPRPSSPAASSSSPNSGLPPERAHSRSSSSAAGAAPAMSPNCSASSSRVSGPSATLRARGTQLELGQQRAQRVAAVQLVGPVGDDDEDALAGQAARQERQRLARRAVGPVQVLDHQQHRALASERVEERQQALEHPRLAALLGGRLRIGRRRAEPGSSGATARAAARSARRRRCARAAAAPPRAAGRAARSRRRSRRSRRPARARRRRARGA